jgi:hypothetical protein
MITFNVDEVKKIFEANPKAKFSRVIGGKTQIMGITAITAKESTNYALWIQTKEDSFSFRNDGVVLHNDREIGKNQELIDEMLKFFKKANFEQGG